MPRLTIAAIAALLLIAVSPGAGQARPSNPFGAPGGADGRWVQAETGKSGQNGARRASAGHRHASRSKHAQTARHTKKAPAASGEARNVSHETGLLPAGSYHRHYRGANMRLVATINAKLARWVHRTGKCEGGTEWLSTQYGSESGKKTASGERFIPSGHTAAHNSLPFGTRLKVWHPISGASVSIRINDRGPATKADIDLSTGAARAIGMRSSSYVCVART